MSHLYSACIPLSVATQCPYLVSYSQTNSTQQKKGHMVYVFTFMDREVDLVNASDPHDPL